MLTEYIGTEGALTNSVPTQAPLVAVKARLYSFIIIAIGVTILVEQFCAWKSQDFGWYLFYLTLAAATARLRLGGLFSTAGIPLAYAFVLFSVMQYSLPQTLLLGCAPALLECVRVIRRRGWSGAAWAQAAFDVCNLSIAITVTYAAYHSRTLFSLYLDPVILLTLTASIFFGMATFPAAIRVSLTEPEGLLKIWRLGYFWSFPYYLAGAALAGLAAILNHLFGLQSGLLLAPVVYLGYRTAALYLKRLHDGRKQAEEMAALHLRTVEALALAIEAQDRVTQDHLGRVRGYALEMGEQLGLTREELDALRSAALLHDIGKLAVPEHIISKPGKLTREEFEKIKIHPVVGAEILERVRFPYPVAPIVRSHHEKWNGSGYPDGLKGEEIPIGARILAVVDRLDTLASDRQSKRALSLPEAIRSIETEAGMAFDPRVVEALQNCCPELEKMAARSQKGSVRQPALAEVESFAAAPQRKLSLYQGAAEKPTDFRTSIAAARQEVQALFELTQDLGSSLSLNETLSLVAIRVKRMIPCESLTVYVPQGNTLRPEYVTGENFRLFSSLEIPLGQGLSGWVAENGKPIMNGNPAAEPGYLNDETRFTTMRSALAVPLLGLHQGPASVLTLYHSQRDAFTQDNLRILLAIAPKVAQAIENAVKYQQAASSAATDYMTGLPNARSLFLHLDSELSRCRRSGASVAVLVGDMNGFKQVNDRFGHLEGNRLLRAVAAKLKESCREYDYVARMGGDEFVVLLPGLTLDQIQPKMQRFDAITREAGREVCNVDTLSLSIGFALFPEDGTDADQLLAEADRRMYLVKHKGKLKVAEPRGYDFDHMLTR